MYNYHAATVSLDKFFGVAVAGLDFWTNHALAIRTMLGAAKRCSSWEEEEKDKEDSLQYCN